MQTTRWLWGVLVLVGTMAVAAQGAQPPSRAERNAVKAQAFAQADADGSGGLSAAELDTFMTLVRQSMKQRMFARADANGDGEVSLEELEAARPRGRRGFPPPAAEALAAAASLVVRLGTRPAPPPVLDAATVAQRGEYAVPSDELLSALDTGSDGDVPLLGCDDPAVGCDPVDLDTPQPAARRPGAAKETLA